MAQRKDGYGLATTAASDEAVAALDATVDAYVRFRRDPGDRLKATFAADPDLPMAHIAKGYFFKLFASGAMAGRARKAAADLGGVAARTGLNEREALHRRALEAWCAEDIVGAIDAWERILIDHPLDVFALRLAHFKHFYTGEAGKMRDSVARALPNWRPEHPHYGNVLGMYAFGLEESGDYRAAERFGRQAVEIDPEDAWSVHAVAHVMEMEGRHAEGIEWVRSLEPRWSVVNNFRFHLQWHRSLYHLERFEFDEVLRLYDEEIVSDLQEDLYLEIVNCAPLLWRLEMYGVDVGDRWEALGEIALKHIDDHELIFVTLHYLMSLIGAGRDAEAVEMVGRMRVYAAEDTTEGRVAAAVGIDAAEAMRALRAGDHAGVIDRLWPIRGELRRMGGSHAQRDLFEQMLVDALEKDGRANMARALLAERTARVPNSAWSWRKYAGALDRAGDAAPAAAARARADGLLAAA